MIEHKRMFNVMDESQNCLTRTPADLQVARCNQYVVRIAKKLTSK